MNTCKITYSSGRPDWSEISAVQLQSQKWTAVADILPAAQVAWDEDKLYLRMTTVEKDILCRYEEFTDPVCEDSCLEFFFCPEAGLQQYFNFECNPNGAMYVGYGIDRANRCRLYRTDWRELLQLQTFRTENGWGLEMAIPADFLRIFAPGFSLKEGATIRANFYKCGDCTAQPHYISWNEVRSDTPDFHRPESFGQLILIK